MRHPIEFRWLCFRNLHDLNRARPPRTAGSKPRHSSAMDLCLMRVSLCETSLGPAAAMAAVAAGGRAARAWMGGVAAAGRAPQSKRHAKRHHHACLRDELSTLIRSEGTTGTYVECGLQPA